MFWGLGLKNFAKMFAGLEKGRIFALRKRKEAGRTLRVDISAVPSLSEAKYRSPELF